MFKKITPKILIAASALLIFLIVILFMWLNKGGSTIDISKKGGSISILLSQAKDLEAQNKLVNTKAIYQKLISDFPNSNEVMKWQRKIEDINIKLIFSSEIIPGSSLYEIKPGDSLNKIAKEFNTTVDLIMKCNNITGNKIYPGKKIKVWTTPFSIHVDKSQNILILKNGEEVIKTYLVSTGKNNSTPVGTFKIVNKLENPTWFKAGAVIPADSPQNILGTRWLGFNLAGYGIHGTTEPESLGKQETQGCVRMSNPEVEELYLIIPQDTEVTIVD